MREKGAVCGFRSGHEVKFRGDIAKQAGGWAHSGGFGAHGGTDARGRLLPELKLRRYGLMTILPRGLPSIK